MNPYLFCAIVVSIPVLANYVLFSSSRKNARRSRAAMDMRGQWHGVVNNTASVGAVALATFVVVLGVVVVMTALPFVIW